MLLFCLCLRFNRYFSLEFDIVLIDNFLSSLVCTCVIVCIKMCLFVSLSTSGTFTHVRTLIRTHTRARDSKQRCVRDCGGECVAWCVCVGVCVVVLVVPRTTTLCRWLSCRADQEALCTNTKNVSSNSAETASIWLSAPHLEIQGQKREREKKVPGPRGTPPVGSGPWRRLGGGGRVK